MIIKRCIEYRLPFSFCKECRKFSPYDGGCLRDDGCRAAVSLYKKYTRKGKDVFSEKGIEVIDEKPVPIYEVVCDECKSKIRYKASEVLWHHITCPVCGVSIWAGTENAVNCEPSKEDG